MYDAVPEVPGDVERAGPYYGMDADELIAVVAVAAGELREFAGAGQDGARPRP